MIGPMHRFTRIHIFANQRMVLQSVLSTLATVLWLVLLSFCANAHEIRPAIADVVVGSQKIEAIISLNGEGILAGVDLGEVFDTDQDINAEEYDLLRGLDDQELADRFAQAWPEIRQQITVQVGDEFLQLDLDAVEITPELNFELPRDTVISVSADLPPGDTPVVVGWVSAYGPLIVREIVSGTEAENPYTGYLIPGALSEPIPRTQDTNAWNFDAFAASLVTGLYAVIPDGPEHILLVLGLFFFSTQWRLLATQLVVFAVAHTTAFITANLGGVALPMPMLVPLLTVTIVYVAIENIISVGDSRFRLPTVLICGLIHGFALAAIFADAGVSKDISSLIGFSVGVDVGLMVAVTVVYLLVGIWVGKKDWYRSYIATPASLLIALFGVGWFIEHTFLV